jgi:hypothetical protein
MEGLFLDIFKVSPILGLMVIMWFYQRKDYTKLVEDTRQDSKEREEELKIIINKNQDIISDLAEKFDVVEDIQKDVTDIKNRLETIKN